MVRRVSPTVVQILATRYGITDQGGRANTAAGMEQSVGSGVIVAADGYIMTNAHVIQNAHDIRVRLVPSGKQTIGAVLSESFSPTIDAVLIGTYTDADLALLKISTEDLPALRMSAPGTVRQGQIPSRSGVQADCRTPSRWAWSAPSPGNSNPTILCFTSRPIPPSIPATAEGRW
jgi:S1-C subfamily serine protease